jgi:hypothetical protein
MKEREVHLINVTAYFTEDSDEGSEWHYRSRSLWSRVPTPGEFLEHIAQCADENETIRPGFGEAVARIVGRGIPSPPQTHRNTMVELAYPDGRIQVSRSVLVELDAPTGADS